jgi:hypothetical protein
VRPSPRSRRSRLSVEPLEGRVVPAGTVLASLSPLGVLTITGDDNDNGVTLKVTGTDIAITPDGTTTLTSTVPATGVVKSINVNLKGGADTLAIDGTAPFQVPGPVTIALGDGDNTLDLVTTGQIKVGALTVKGGDGMDTATVSGGSGLGSLVTGAASFLYGTGGSSTTLNDLKVGTSLRVIAGDAGGQPNELLGTNLTVVGPVTAALSNANPATVSLTTSTVGGLVETGFVVGTSLKSSMVKGSVAIRATYQGDLQADGAIVTGSVVLAGALPSLEASGAGTTINGNLTLTGTGWTTTSFATDTLSKVKGAVTVVGGWYNDQFVTNGNFEADKSVTLTLNGGENSVTIGDGTAPVAILGGLTIRGGAVADAVALNEVSVGGAALIALGAGADSVAIENGSQFAKAFTADLGTGDDTITVAQNTAPTSTGPTTFTGVAKILGGAGNDTLLLGLDPLAGGDTNSRAVFTSGLANLVDGGLGLDFFDVASANVTGVTPTGWNL